MNLCSLFVACTLMLAAENTAHADDAVVHAVSGPTAALPPAPPPPPVSPESPTWYGWQTLSADGASVALLAVAAVWGSSGSSGNGTGPLLLLGGGLGGLALGGPIVHIAHGHPLRALADVGLRVGAVFAGGFAGAEIANAATAHSACQNNNDIGCLPEVVGGLALGAIVGAGAASAIDASVLAYDRPAPTAAPVSAFMWTPSVSMLKGGGVAGVSGTF